MALDVARQELAGTLEGEVRAGEPLKMHTTWRIGGPADLLVLPASAADVQKTLQFALLNHLPVAILGNGSNILVSDHGVRGIVLKTTNLMQEVHFDGPVVVAAAGIILSSLARMAMEKGLAGLEFAAGIPASVGGATAMNAGAHGSSLSEVVEEVDFLRQDGSAGSLEAGQARFGYRTSIFREEGYIITRVKLRLREAGEDPGAERDPREKTRGYMEQRLNSQPGGASAGSVFKNPPGGPAAGWLLEQAGCKGMEAGDAYISDKHANFIINRGNASAAEVLELIAQARARVLEKFGVKLETEVQIMGESP